MALLVAGSAQAQLAVPTLPTLPTTPGTALPGGVQLPQLPTSAVNNTVRRLDAVINDATTEVDTQGQRLLRAARVRELLRANPDTLEADPNGMPVLRGQLIALSPTPQALQAIVAAGFIVSQEQGMDDLGIRMVTLQAPAGMSIRRALRRLRALDSSGSYDYNHVYLQSAANSPAANKSTSSTAVAAQPVDPGIRVGLIDGGVASTHPVFHGSKLISWGCDPAKPSAHGTAVASLLVGNSEHFSGAAPGATLYAADVYCGQPVGGSMVRIAAALSWLVQQQVPVINISLVGPDNALLKQLMNNLIARGHVVVAAVGNDGPAAAPLYPAAYPGVVGVTAVDAHDRVLVEAGRGKQVDFAAPGADMAAAVLDDVYANVRGTSFAAPLVAGLLAHSIKTPQPAAALQAINILVASAQDAGSRGVDKTYGNGVVGESLRVTLAGLPTKSDQVVTAVH
ncbi:MAG: S8 family serine peptidase [Steroidobacteraceae bacterium]